MMLFFANKTTPIAALLSLFVLLSVAFGCKQDQKTAAPTPGTETTTAPPATREEAPAPTEDYSASILDVAKKEYEPLGRKILANHEKLKALKAANASSSGIRNEGEAKDLGKRQSDLEAGFVENMKMLDYLVEKQNSGEMSKADIETEKKAISKKIKEIESATTNLETALKSEKN